MFSDSNSRFILDLTSFCLLGMQVRIHKTSYKTEAYFAGSTDGRNSSSISTNLGRDQMNQNIGTKTENNISTGGHFGISHVIRVSSVTLRLGRDTNFLPNNHSTCNMQGFIMKATRRHQTTYFAN